MPKTKELSIEMRALIVSNHRIGKSNRQIARELNISRQTVDYNVNKFASGGSLSNKKRSGRPVTTTPAEDRQIVMISKRNRRKTAPEIAAEVSVGRRKQISVTTVKRRLGKAGLHGRVAVRKPLLRKKNKQKRYAWAQAHKNWTVEDWKQVLWSDESKFEIYGSRRRVFVRRQVGERVSDQCIVPTVKHGGGSVMIWRCFAGTSVGDLVKIDGILRKEGYKNILQHNVVPSGLRLVGEKFTFQHDNDPKHTAKICRDYLHEKEEEGSLTVMEWPPQSPDLNPIELLWDELDRKVKTVAPTSAAVLWTLLQQEWATISEETLTKLIARMPRLCAAVITNKGGYIDESNV